jgi:hypothetical protein
MEQRCGASIPRPFALVLRVLGWLAAAILLVWWGVGGLLLAWERWNEEASAAAF